MKFTVSAVVVLVLMVAAGGHSSVIPVLTHSVIVPPLSYTAHTRDLGLGGLQGVDIAGEPAQLVAAGPVLVAAHPHLVAAHPWVDAHAVHLAPAVVPVPVVAAEGSYVAQNRGAVHVAALPGHSQSASSINLEPAPGTL